MDNPSKQRPELDLEQVQHFASLLLTNEELDVLLELDRGTVEKALFWKDDELGKAVAAGRLKTKCELHVSLLTTARRHSTPAQQMVNDLVRKLDSQ